MGNNSIIVFTKKYFFIGIGMLAIVFLTGCSLQLDDDFGNYSKNVSIAACPTYYDFVQNNYNIQLTKTNSTSQSLDLLKRGSVDYVLAGRTPKPGEFQGDYKTLGSGYSFLSRQGTTIGDQELQTIKFYTDLNDTKSIKKIFGIQNLEKVENIYDYSNNNIIITSRENTDYNKANIVHVLHPNGQRYTESRIPILYCKDVCDKEIIKLFTKKE